MNIQIAGLVQEDPVNAPGISLTVFCQGCWHPEDTPNMCKGHCIGCHNPDTQPKDGGVTSTTEEILDKLKSSELHNTLVISGGEPICQIEPVTELAKKAKEAGYKIWLYSGYTFEQLEQNTKWQELKQYVDVLVDGPFIKDLKSIRLKFRGSKNQRLIDIQKSIKKGVIINYKK